MSEADLILWTAPKHSGKTTAALALAEAARARGFAVVGLAAPSVWRDGRLVGFDGVDLRTARRAVLARRDADGPRVGSFAFTAGGLALGAEALAPPAGEADLVIVDEFGPLELSGGGWRGQVEALRASTGAVLLLVVRTEILAPVRNLYPSGEVLGATDGEAVERVLAVLAPRRADRGSGEPPTPVP